MGAAEAARSLTTTPTSPTRPGYTLFDALQRVVDRRPVAVAVRCGGDVWTYAELRDRSVRLGNAWRAAGVVAGERVVVLSDNCHRYVELYWAAAYLGAVIVPIEARLGDDEIRAIVDEVAPAVAFAAGGKHLATLRRVAPHIGLLISDGPLIGDGPVISDGINDLTVADYEQLLAGSTAEPLEGAADPDDAVALYFTAAVEGRSRGAVVTHRNLLVQAVQTAEAMGLGLDDAQGIFLPLSHTFGGYLMFVAACQGSANTLLATFDPVVAAGLIAAGDVTWFAGFAPMPARIADAAQDNLGRLRAVMGLDGAASIQRYLDLGVRWWNFYGQTETAGLVTMGEVTAGRVTPNDVGRPLSLCRVSLRDQAGRPVPAGEAGEAWVRSDAVVRRYWPDEPTRLTDDGWLRTGDVLRGDGDGDLYFVGRTTDKDLIKPGGLNVYPAEVEAVLAAHPSVRKAWVFGLPDPDWRERVCAVVVPVDPADPPDPDALRAHCRVMAAAFKCPQQIVVALDLAENEIGGTGAITRETARVRYSATISASTSSRPTD
jgi:acyl-CoA synthetase (AMP-forming)/AMP-acid ligase II